MNCSFCCLLLSPSPSPKPSHEWGWGPIWLCRLDTEMPSMEPPSYDTNTLMDLLKPLLDVKSRPQPALGSQLTSSRQSCYNNFGTHQKKLKKIEVIKKHNLFFCWIFKFSTSLFKYIFSIFPDFQTPDMSALLFAVDVGRKKRSAFCLQKFYFYYTVFSWHV